MIIYLLKCESECHLKLLYLLWVHINSLMHKQTYVIKLLCKLTGPHSFVCVLQFVLHLLEKILQNYKPLLLLHWLITYLDKYVSYNIQHSLNNNNNVTKAISASSACVDLLDIGILSLVPLFPYLWPISSKCDW